MGLGTFGVEVFHDMESGLKDADIIMMLRLQTERMAGNFVPSIREYYQLYGLDYNKLKFAKPNALIMHPGPMNRGVEIDSELADDIDRSLIREQVEMGVEVDVVEPEEVLAPEGARRRHCGVVWRGARRLVLRRRSGSSSAASASFLQRAGIIEARSPTMA